MDSPEHKAEQLFNKHGFDVSNTIVDAILDENIPEYIQNKIDYWLDVKNELIKNKWQKKEK